MLMKLFEGKYDRLTGIVVDAIWYMIKDSKKIYDEQGENIYAIESIPITDIVNFNLNIIINREENFKGGFIADAATVEDTIYLAIYIDPKLEPKIYVKVNENLQTAIRHEIEHILQEQNFPQRMKIPSREEVEQINDDPYTYFMTDYEVEAMVMGFYRLAKTKKEKLDSIIDEYLQWWIDDKSITSEEAEEIKQKWLAYAKKQLPRAQYKLVRESFEDYLTFSDGDEEKYTLQRKLVVDPLKGQFGATLISWEEYMKNKKVIDDNFDVEYVEYGESPVRILPKEGDEETAWWLEDK